MKIWIVIVSVLAAPVLGSNVTAPLGSCSALELDLMIPASCKTLWSNVLAAVTGGTETLKAVATQVCDPYCGKIAFNTVKTCYPSATNIATILDQVCATNRNGAKCDAIYGNFTLTQLLDIGLPCYLQSGSCDPQCSANLVTLTNEWGCCLDVYGTSFSNRSVQFVSFWKTCNLIFPGTCVGAFSSHPALAATSAIIGMVILLVTMAILE